MRGVGHPDDFAVLGRAQGELGAVAHAFHELVGDVDAVVEVETLAVEVAAGLTDFEEFFDFGVMDVQVNGGRAAAERALADRQRQGIHNPDERNDPGGLAILADLFADRADRAPIGADPAAIGGQPDVLVPGFHDVVERVAHSVQEAGDRQATVRAAIGEHGGGRHEPQPGHVIVDALGVGEVVGISRGDPGEHVLEGLARQKVAILKRRLAEISQKGVA